MKLLISILFFIFVYMNSQNYSNVNLVDNEDSIRKPSISIKADSLKFKNDLRESVMEFETDTTKLPNWLK